MNKAMMKSIAVFSTDRKYRYLLLRCWDEKLPVVNYVLLNPSIADEDKNDPTVERCVRRSKAGGYGTLLVTNLFAFVATDPNSMKVADYPIGRDNDKEIVKAAKSADMVVCAWGSNGSYCKRDKEVLRLLMDNECAEKIHSLRPSVPCHPLYLPYDLLPVPWNNFSLAT